MSEPTDEEVRAIANKLTAPQRRVLALSGDDRFAANDWAIRDRLSTLGLLRRRMASRDVPYRTPLGDRVLADLPNAKPAKITKKPEHPPNAKNVALAWKEGRRLTTRALSTDGRSIFSYRLQIGCTDSRGKKVAYDYRQMISGTTSMHCGVVMSAADRTIQPPEPKAQGRSR